MTDIQLHNIFNSLINECWKDTLSKTDQRIRSKSLIIINNSKKMNLKSNNEEI